MEKSPQLKSSTIKKFTIYVPERMIKVEMELPDTPVTHIIDEKNIEFKRTPWLLTDGCSIDGLEYGWCFDKKFPDPYLVSKERISKWKQNKKLEPSDSELRERIFKLIKY